MESNLRLLNIVVDKAFILAAMHRNASAMRKIEFDVFTVRLANRVRKMAAGCLDTVKGSLEFITGDLQSPLRP